jgi:3-phenylpropionate/trans-cinnamate dioxygenase ferredoxin subunit
MREPFAVGLRADRFFLEMTMSEWQAVCGEQQLAEGEFQIVWDGDNAIAVYRTTEGWFAVEDVCTHDGAELAGGAVHGCVVECPRHGARFDLRTGAALCAPAYEPIHVFPLKIEAGVVYVRDDRED